MKTASLQLVVLAAIVEIVFSEIGPADSKSRTYFSDGKSSGQDTVLYRLSRTFGAGLSWIFSDATTCGPNDRVLGESVTRLC